MVSMLQQRKVGVEARDNTYTPHHVSVQFACLTANVNALRCASDAHRQDASRMRIQIERSVNSPLDSCVEIIELLYNHLILRVRNYGT